MVRKKLIRIGDFDSNIYRHRRVVVVVIVVIYAIDTNNIVVVVGGQSSIFFLCPQRKRIGAAPHFPIEQNDMNE